MFKTKAQRDRSERPVVDTSKDKRIVKEEFRDEANINSIMAKAQRTGILVDPAKINTARTARFDNLGTPRTYQEIQNQMVQLNKEFEKLPSEVRLMFHNDPGNMLDYMADPANEEDCIQLGLMPSKAVAKPPEGEEVGQTGTPAPEKPTPEEPSTPEK